MDVDVADALEVGEDRHARLVLDAVDQALAAARHDHVDRAVEAGQHRADRGAVAGRHELDRRRPAGRRLGQALDQAAVDRAGRAERVGAAAQDRGVAGLEAERAGVGGDVRAALVDDADDAERRAHALDVEAVRAVPGGDDRADRIGQGGDLLDALAPSPRCAPASASAGRRTRRCRLRCFMSATSRALAARIAGAASADRGGGLPSAPCSSRRSSPAPVRARAARAARPIAAISASMSAERGLPRGFLAGSSGLSSGRTRFSHACAAGPRS